MINELVAVCEVNDLWAGEMETFDAGDTEVLLVNHNGEFFAYGVHCPHQSVELINGKLDDYTLTCPAHSWQFDVRSGSGINPSSACLVRYDTEVCEGKVYVATVPSKT